MNSNYSLSTGRPFFSPWVHSAASRTAKARAASLLRVLRSMPTPPKTGSNAARKRAAAPTTEASHKRAATRTHTPAGDDDVLRFARTPPPWLNMTSAKALRLNADDVEHWTASAGGKAAAQRGEELDQLRLLGSVELSFTRDDCCDGLLAERLGLLEKPTKSRVADAKWHRSRRPVDPDRAL